MRPECKPRARILDSVAADEVVAELYARGADAEAVRAIVARGMARAMLVGPLKLEDAQALRKAAAEAGGLAVMTRPAGRQDPGRADVVVMAPTEKLSAVADGLGGETGERMRAAMAGFFAPVQRVLRCRGRDLALGAKTLVMGIINVTPDSFSGDGLGGNTAAAIAQGTQMVADGADILDVGGESTRPGADPVSIEDEIARVLPVIGGLTREVDVPISIDTYKCSVAAAALAKGASIVNDISGLRFDTNMANAAAEAGAAVIAMHIRGTPRDMQKDPKYDDVIGEISEYLEESIALAEAAGLTRDRIVVDPGFGFGKTLEHNLELLRRLREFRSLGCAVMIGTSRKSSIGKLLGDAPADERIMGTAATVALAIAAGADIVRVHDVKEMVQVARVADAVVRVQHEPPAGSEHKWAHQR
ncbi:MAG: dihydropteroate synthase [Armatimonadota bacterium]